MTFKKLPCGIEKQSNGTQSAHNVLVIIDTDEIIRNHPIALLGHLYKGIVQMNNHQATVNFFVFGKDKQFARRVMFHIPRIGDICVFMDVRYSVVRVEWCMDEDATVFGVRVNVELAAI